MANEVFTARGVTCTGGGSVRYDKTEQSKMLLDRLKGINKSELTELYKKMNSDIVNQGGFESDIVNWLKINEQEINDSMQEVR
jgi:hypothetical protein